MPAVPIAYPKQTVRSRPAWTTQNDPLGTPDDQSPVVTVCLSIAAIASSSRPNRGSRIA